MPVTKRTTKVVSYHEHDDDDDFIPAVDITKQNRNMKSNDSSKTTTKQSTRKRDEKVCKPEQEEEEEPVLILQPTKDHRIAIDEKENSSSQSTVSSCDSKTPSQHITDVDEHDEDLSPKIKRMKHVEEDDTNENEVDNENEEKLFCEVEETNKKNEIPAIDLDTSRTSSTRTSDLATKKSSVPIGFPTSKINIPSPHAPRVGLSRKSSTIKPLHPTFTSRVVHE